MAWILHKYGVSDPHFYSTYTGTEYRRFFRGVITKMADDQRAEVAL